MVLTLAVPILLSAQPLRLEFVGQWGGTASALDVSGTTVYLGEGPRLVVIDVSDPESPIEVGRSEPLPSVILDIDVADGYVYVAADLYGLYIFSLEDPANPVAVGHLGTLDATQAVHVAGDIAYVADRGQGLSAVSVVDKTAPERIGWIDTPGDAEGVVIVGDIAYVADRSGGLRLILAADPANLIELGAFETPSSAYHVAVDGSTAYVSDSEAGLYVLSVEDASEPVEQGFLSVSRAGAVAVAGSIAYVASDWSRIVTVSVSDSGNPVEIGRTRIPDRVQSLAVSGGLLYAAVTAAGLRVLSPTDEEAELTIVGLLDTAMYAVGVALSGDTVYVTDLTDGVHAISVADPATPELVGFLDLPEAGPIDASGSRAVVCAYTTFVILDIANADDPAEIGRVGLPETAAALALAGDYAYAVCPYAGLQVISLADPAAPEIVASLPLDGYAQAIDLVGELTYVGANGVRVVSIADPLQPKVIGTFSSDDLARSIRVTGDLLLLAEGSILRTFSVADPTAPVELGRYVFGLGPTLDLYGAYAVAGIGWAGLRLVALADPANPAEAARLDTPHHPGAVIVSGDLVFAADQEGGLVVARVVGEK